MIRFQRFLGIDQTGATDSKGQPRPLPVALLAQSGNTWQLHFSKGPERLELSGITQEKILNLLSGFSLPGRDLSRTGLILDSVFGLPQKNWPFRTGGSDQLFKLFQRAFEFEHNGKKWGRDTAENFFAEFLKKEMSAMPLPQRICEVKSGANSVFLTKPFQRNIGCGTFRIWKELGSSAEKWFQIWGFDHPVPHLQDGPWIFEAYPSLFWKKILGFSTRQPKDLVRWLKTQAPSHLVVPNRQLSLLLEDPDLCDSVVLALSAWLLQERNEIWQIPEIPHLSKEGWILGL